MTRELPYALRLMLAIQSCERAGFHHLAAALALELRAHLAGK